MNGWRLIEFYANPSQFAQDATATDWTILTHTAREYGLLATCYPKLQSIEFQHKAAVIRHAESSVYFANKQYLSLVQELLALEPVFAECGYPVLLVKGSAYRLAGFEYAKYRLFSDIDILVAKQNTEDALTRLRDCGYMEHVESDYERNYYIQWSHQYPPLKHFMRTAEIDLHHTIFFAKSKVTIDIATFIQRAKPIENSAFSIPSTADMFVHACLHLFYQEETQKLAKDLIDLHCLYLQIHHKNDILQAAQLVNKRAAIVYGLMVQSWLFQQQLSIDELSFIKSHCSTSKLKWMRATLTALLKPSTFLQPLAELIWLLRGHFIKMNIQTLSYHMVMRLVNQYQKNKRHTIAQKKIDAETLPEDARSAE